MEKRRLLQASSAVILTLSPLFSQTVPGSYPYCANGGTKTCRDCPEEDDTCEGSDGTADSSGDASTKATDGGVTGAFGHSSALGRNLQAQAFGSAGNPAPGADSLDFQRISNTRIPNQNFLQGRFGQAGAWSHNYAYAAADETDSLDNVGVCISLPGQKEIRFQKIGSTYSGVFQNTETGNYASAANLPYTLTQSGNLYTVSHASGKQVVFERLSVINGGVTSYFYRVKHTESATGYRHTFSYPAPPSGLPDTATDPSVVTDGSGSRLEFYYNNISTDAVLRYYFNRRLPGSGTSDLQLEPFVDERLPGLVDTNQATLGTWMNFEVTNASSLSSIPACQAWAVYTTNRGVSSNPLAVSEFKLYDENGVELTGGTAFGSPGTDVDHEAAKIRDGITTTGTVANLAAANCWRPPFVRNAYVGVDFGAGNFKKVRKVSIFVPSVTGVTLNASGGVATTSFQIVAMQSTSSQNQKVLASVAGFRPSGISSNFEAHYGFAEQGDGIFGRANLATASNTLSWDTASFSYTQIQPYTRQVLVDFTDPSISKGSQNRRYEFYSDGSLGTTANVYGQQIVGGVGANTLKITALTCETANHPVMTASGKEVRYSMISGSGFGGTTVNVSNGNVRKKEYTATVNGVAVTTQKFFTYDAGGAGYLISSRDENGNLTTYVRDSLGRATSVTRADGTVEGYTYVNGLLTQKTVTFPVNGVNATRTTDYVYVDKKLFYTTSPLDAMGRREMEFWIYAASPCFSEPVLWGHQFHDGSQITTDFSWADFGATLVTNTTDRHGIAHYSALSGPGYFPGAQTSYDEMVKATVAGSGSELSFSFYQESFPGLQRSVVASGFSGYTYRQVETVNGGRDTMFQEAGYLPNSGWQNSTTLTYTDNLHDDFGRQTQSTDGLGGVTTTAYESASGSGSCSCNTGSSPTLVTDASGRKTRYRYDGFWRRTATIIAADTADQLRYDYEYDSVGNLTREYQPYAATTRPSGQLYTQHFYDNRNRRWKTEEQLTASLIRTTTYTFDGAGNVLVTTRPDGATITNTYDGRDRLITSTVANATSSPVIAPQTTSYEYDIEGRVTKVTTPALRVTTKQYLLGGRLWKETQGAGTAQAATTTYSYDLNNGQISTLTAPDGKVSSYFYDSRGQLDFVLDHDFRFTSYIYDAIGRRLRTDLPDGTSTSKTYDALSRVKTEKDQNNLTTTYDYYATGELWKMTDPKNVVRQWNYNGRGQLVSKIWPDATFDQYTYNASGRLKTHVVPGAVGVAKPTETLTYLEEATGGALTSTSRWANSNSSTHTDYAYDTLGRTSTITQPVKTGGTSQLSHVKYTYDGFSRKASESQGLSDNAGVGLTMTGTTFTATTPTIGYEYDSDGNLEHLIYPDGTVVDYTYTSRNQLYQVSNAGPPPVATYGYDLAGRPTLMTMENSVATDYGYGTVGQTNTGQLTSVQHRKGAAAYFDGVAYGLDINNDRRTGITRAGGWNDTYGYDNAGQVTSGTYAAGVTSSEGFVYDNAGNRTSATRNGTATAYVPTVLDTYASIGGLSEVNDARGNLTTLARPGVANVTMTWDGNNQLITAVCGTPNVKHTYDALHRRTLKRIYASGTLTKQIVYLYDGWNVIEEREYSATDVLQKRTRYTWGRDVSGSLQGAGGVGGLLMAEVMTVTSGVSGTPIQHYYHYDGNGNVITITDASGNSEGRYRYTAFGALTNTSGLSAYASTQPYRFSTKYLDAEVETQTGMYYYGYRYYLPGIGRWINRDPIEEEGGMNLYGMVGNDTIAKVDIFGMSPLTGAVAGGELGTIVCPGFGTVIGGIAGLVIGIWVTHVIVTEITKPEPYIPAVEPREPAGGEEKRRDCVDSRNLSPDAAADAPGKPTEADGFVPPKKGPGADGSKVKNPNGPGKGWIDEKGDVWVPTGNGPNAHGGPHWDVQTPGPGRPYRNVRPRR